MHFLKDLLFAEKFHWEFPNQAFLEANKSHWGELFSSVFIFQYSIQPEVSQNCRSTKKYRPVSDAGRFAATPKNRSMPLWPEPSVTGHRRRLEWVRSSSGVRPACLGRLLERLMGISELQPDQRGRDWWRVFSIFHSTTALLTSASESAFLRGRLVTRNATARWRPRWLGWVIPWLFFGLFTQRTKIYYNRTRFARIVENHRFSRGGLFSVCGVNKQFRK